MFLRILHPHLLPALIKIGPLAICDEMRKCVGTGRGRCVNTDFFRKKRIWVTEKRNAWTPLKRPKINIGEEYWR